MHSCTLTLSYTQLSHRPTGLHLSHKTQPQTHKGLGLCLTHTRTQNSVTGSPGSLSTCTHTHTPLSHRLTRVSLLHTQMHTHNSATGPQVSLSLSLSPLSHSHTHTPQSQAHQALSFTHTHTHTPAQLHRGLGQEADLSTHTTLCYEWPLPSNN